MTTLLVQRVCFEGRHGATAEERRTTRRFEVDVEIDADVDAARRSDRLADTIDYRLICETILRLGEGEPHRLLESLGQRMIDALRAKLPTGSVVRLELRKLSPPGCVGQPASAGVRLASTDPLR